MFQITRSRNKWKFYLKDGIMNLAGKDFVFQKANGDAEWWTGSYNKLIVSYFVHWRMKVNLTLIDNRVWELLWAYFYEKLAGCGNLEIYSCKWFSVLKLIYCLCNILTIKNNKKNICRFWCFGNCYFTIENLFIFLC